MTPLKLQAVTHKIKYGRSFLLRGKVNIDILNVVTRGPKLKGKEFETKKIGR